MESQGPRLLCRVVIPHKQPFSGLFWEFHSQGEMRNTDLHGTGQESQREQFVNLCGAGKGERISNSCLGLGKRLQIFAFSPRPMF